ncbi:hypothetical protein MXB_1417 [Myxobolus squamalis]|nr:hypothetical protein MXB_1417 [Myxobolus squamalis]
MFRIVRNSKFIAKILHTVLHISAFLITAIGIWAIFQFKVNNQKTHYFSLHSIFGIIFVVLYFSIIVSSCLVFWVLDLSIATKLKFKSFHVMIGKAMLISATMISFLGMGRYFWKSSSSSDLPNILASLLGFFMTSLLFIAIALVFSDEFKVKIN